MKSFIAIIHSHKYIFILIVFTFISLTPLLHQGLHPTHDGEYHVVRFYEFFQVFNEGVLYPRWAPDLNNGFGVPLFNYVYPLPNYVSVFLHYMGFSFIDSFKINLFFGTLTGVLFFYFWTKQYWGEFGALVAATSYAYAPYRFVDVYVRGSVGEVWSLAFFPAYLWSFSMLARKNTFFHISLPGIFLAGIIFSHNILAVMFLPVAITYCILLIHKARNKILLFRSLLLSYVIGIGLSAIFWLPALTETRFVRGLELYDVEKNFPDLYQLVIPSWGTGFSGGSLQNQMSFQIGLVPLVIVIVSIYSLLVLFRESKKKEFMITAFHLMWFIISCFFMLRASNIFWQKFPLFNYFQFPWRFLSIVIFCTSFLAGSVVYIITVKPARYVAGGIIILLSMVLTLSYTKPAYYHNRNDNHYINRENFIHGTNSPGNLFNTIWMGDTEKMEKGLQFLSGSGKIVTDKERSSYRKYNAYVDNTSVMQVKAAYFPGWTVYLDGKNHGISKTKNGLLTFPVQKGKHTIEIIFLDTILRQVAVLWSVCTVVMLLVIILEKQIRYLKV